MSTKSRIGKLEHIQRKQRGGARVVGVCDNTGKPGTDPDIVTVDGETMARAEFEKLYPDGTLLIVQNRPG